MIDIELGPLIEAYIQQLKSEEFEVFKAEQNELTMRIKEACKKKGSVPGIGWAIGDDAIQSESTTTENKDLGAVTG